MATKFATFILRDPELDARLRARFDDTLAAMQVLRDTASGGMAYDQMIAEGNDAGNAIVQAAIDALLAQTREIERVVSRLELRNLEFQGSDSFDPEEDDAGEAW